MILPIHALLSPFYRQEFPLSYRELLLETCQEFDRACTRDIVRMYSENAPELSIGTHIDRMIALEAALEIEDKRDPFTPRLRRIYPIHNALHKVRDNLHELTGIVMGGAA